MRAVTWNELGAQPALRDDLPEPAPGAGEVLVRVHAGSWAERIVVPEAGLTRKPDGVETAAAGAAPLAA